MAASDRWQEVERLFYAALSCAPARREELLSNQCTDPDILAEVVSLLDAHEKAASTFDKPPDTLVADFLEHIEEQQDPLIGASFAHYEVIGMLGQGGMGRVYLARDSRLGRKVALKVLPSSHVRSMDGLRRFAQEARLASALNHPNIITVYDYGEAFSSYYIATEYVEGPTLRYLIDHGLEMAKALDIAIQMASALGVAHRSGVIHRDIKPENIIVRDDGIVKVLDFGLAKSAAGRDSTNAFIDTPETIPGAIMGTFRYMSPEQARGRELDPRTDVFSFGIVLFEMLAGSRPFHAENLVDLLDSLANKNAPRLSTLAPDIPVDLEAITGKALARDLDSRYQTFEAVLADLTSVKRRLDAGEKLEIASERPAEEEVTLRPESGSNMSAEPPSRSATTGGKEGMTATHDSSVVGVRAGPKRFPYYVMVALLLIIGAVSYRAVRRLWPFEKKSPSNPPQLSSSPRPITKPKTNSIVTALAVSRDGKYFAYAQPNEISIVKMPSAAQDREEPVRSPLALKGCSGLAFSSDGSYLYSIDGTSDNDGHDLYRIPVQEEGAPTKIKVDIGKSISFSRDGSRFVFVRNSARALMTARADGSDERTLSVLDDVDELWLYPAWSPDDRLIACGVMNQKKRGQRLYGVDLKDGSRKPIGDSIWTTLLNVAWVTDTSGVIADAAEDEAHAPTIWYIAYPDGAPTRITNELYGYYGVSLTADSGTLISAREDLKAHLYIAEEGENQPPKDVSPGLSSAYGATGLAWTRDGTVVYDAGPSQHKHLYEIDPAGGGQAAGRQLSDANDISPSLTPDDQYIVFASDRGGKLGIWRMDRFGANPIPLAEDGWKPSCLLEAKWVVYQAVSGGRTHLWKVPITGGQPESLTAPDFDAENAAVSPDGKRVAFLLSRAGARPQIAILEGEKVLPTRYSLPDSISQPIIRWRSNNMLIYVDEHGKTAEMWQQRLQETPGQDAVDQPRPYVLPQAEFRCIFNFDWSKDGRIILSAGDTRSVEVDALTLTKQPG